MTTLVITACLAEDGGGGGGPDGGGGGGGRKTPALIDSGIGVSKTATKGNRCSNRCKSGRTEKILFWALGIFLVYKSSSILFCL